MGMAVCRRQLFAAQATLCIYHVPPTSGLRFDGCIIAKQSYGAMLLGTLVPAVVEVQHHVGQ